LGLVAAAGGLLFWSALLHFDAGQAPTPQLLQSAPLDKESGLGAGTNQSAEQAAAPSCGGNAPGMADPAAVYCNDLGYTYQTVTKSAEQNGACVFPDGSSCDAWDFLEGKCGQGYSYCAKQGYGVTT
jgi:putative hemolysin